jgi:site-specific DNA-methyltransferase (adenine-specific)
MSEDREMLRMPIGPRGTSVDTLVEGRNRLLHGDCLTTSRTVDAGSVALVYADPPFGSGRPQPFRGGLARREAPLLDRGGWEFWWSGWGERIEAMLTLVKPAGIFVLHLDSRLAPFARVALEARLGTGHFLNEIVWHYRSGGIPRDRLAQKHDTLLVYRTGAGHTFHRITEKRYLAHRAMRAGVEEFRDERGWYRHVAMDDVWEIGHIAPDARERLGYPTQKPEALIERLILAFTNEGDVVADLACGSGTLPAVAQRLGRRWIAGDRDPRAIVCAAGRLARGISPALEAEWNHAGIEARRGDLKRRLDRWRRAPETWGLSAPELRDATAGDALAPGFWIEWSALDGG